MNRAVLLLASGTFAIGTDTFVIAGVLPVIAKDMNVTPGQTGQLVTVYAIGIALLSPLLVTATSRLPRKSLLVCALTVFAAGNLLSAAAPSFAVLVSSRLLAAAGAAVYTPVAASTAAAISPAAVRGRALATVLGGATVATVFGVPLAVIVGVQWQWRATFVALALLGAATAGALHLAFPHPPLIPVASLRQRVAVLGNPRIALVLLTTLLFFLGGFVVYTYLAVVLPVSRDQLVVALLVFGVAGTVGTFTSGRVTDRFGAGPVLCGGLTGFAAALLLLPSALGNFPAELACLAMWGFSAWALTVPQQARLLELVPSAGMVAIGLNSAAVFLGIGISASIGAWLLEDLSPALLSYAGGSAVLAALAVAVAQLVAGRVRIRSAGSVVVDVHASR